MKASGAAQRGSWVNAPHCVRALAVSLLMLLSLAWSPMAAAANLQVAELSDTGSDPTPAGGVITYQVSVLNSDLDTVDDVFLLFDLPPGATAVSTPVPQNLTLTANLLFDFDRDTMSRVRAESLRGVDDAFKRVADEKLRITSVQLVGHADRLQGPNRQYNQALSERRALAVRQYLVDKGIPADVISYEWRGDTEQVQACDGMSGARLKECLLPNRRVEVKFQVER